MATTRRDPVPFRREVHAARLASGERFDLLVVGGGATGAGVAVDAASRGYRVALCEQADFGKGTSSRSTKLVHGGVRYLEQGDVGLVRDALRERGLLLRNAPHLVYRLPIVLPLYRWWEPFYYRAGLAVYDLLAGRLGLGRSTRLSRRATIEALPTIRQPSLRGGVRYYDGGFDDARLLINLVQTAADHGAVCLNHARVDRLMKEGDRVVGAEVVDLEKGVDYPVRASVVVNAAGPYSDGVRRLAESGGEDWIQPSQGVHIVLDREFLPGDDAIIVPRTRDGRVVFAIPWHGKTLVGTTDTALDATPLEPVPRRHEIDFLLETISGVLCESVNDSDVRSVFAGLRPLVRKDGSSSTSKLGRDHSVRVGPEGLVTVLGGKWTTYRKMAEDCVDRCADVAGLPRSACRTEKLSIRSDGDPEGPLSHYGCDATAVRGLIAGTPEYAEPIDVGLPYTVGEAVWAIRGEMARTVEDVLSRRLRALLLDADAACRAAPRVAELLAAELGRDDTWARDQSASFSRLAEGYKVTGCERSSA
ncbi:glycerol-3-phosphate dehydrogenase/oxidase [Botrimarina sp.]|uniref:glycerol-3-phosphate dehydrogenase/oxidase n=1 Tax=Botrimarina sp. TaxID=2795802 RepID=UPI0032EFE488